MNIFTQLFAKKGNDHHNMQQKIRQDLLRREAAIGKQLFGLIPAGHNREFFRIDSKTWIWQETWLDNGKRVTRETKYVVRERDVIKSIGGTPYQKVSLEEAQNLRDAITIYAQRVKTEVYNAS